MDNGLLRCRDAKRAQALANSLSAAKIDALVRKWFKDQVALIFGKRVTRRTPGWFRRRVLTQGVMAALHLDYFWNRSKHTLGRLPEPESTHRFC